MSLVLPLAGPAGEPVDLWRTLVSHGIAALPPGGQAVRGGSDRRARPGSYAGLAFWLLLTRDWVTEELEAIAEGKPAEHATGTAPPPEAAIET